MVNIIFLIILMHHDLFNAIKQVSFGFVNVHREQSLIRKLVFAIIHLLLLKLEKNNKTFLIRTFLFQSSYIVFFSSLLLK